MQMGPPDGYKTPPFPSLYFEFRDNSPTAAHSLFNVGDIWRFTLLWTLIIYAIFHLGAAAIAVFMHGKNKSSWKFLWTVPLVYVFVSAIEALFAGSIVGVMLGAIYNAGYFSMSPWIPFVWGWISVLILIISSFSMQGGL